MSRPTRNGKPLQVLQDGHPRRMSDGRNAFRKMDGAQRAVFLLWCIETGTDEDRAGDRAQQESGEDRNERHRPRIP